MEKEAIRSRAGVLVSASGICLNLILAAAKIAAGALFGLVSVIADGLNNISDCGSSLVSLVSFRVAEKPADKRHPYGHHRAEYIASMIIGFIIMFLGAEVLRESIAKIASGELAVGNMWIYVILGISLGVKAIMFVGYRIAAVKLQSETLRAASADSACDCLSTAVVLTGAATAGLAGFPADGWGGIVVAVLILIQGVFVIKDAGSELLGQAPDPALVSSVKEMLLGGEGVLGVHDVRVYGYGRGAYFATAHVEMEAGVPALRSHALLDMLERKAEEELGVSLVVHLDPVDLNDGEARGLEERVKNAISDMGEGITVHDFRLVRGAKDKLVFDAAAPYSCKLANDELKREIEIRVRELGDYDAVVTIDRQ